MKGVSSYVCYDFQIIVVVLQKVWKERKEKLH